MRDYSGKQPGKPTYDSIDLGQYLQSKTRRDARPVPAARPLGRRRRNAATDDEDDAGRRQPTRGTIEDTRLILVTDLGFIVKRRRTAAATSSCSRSAPACRWRARASSSIGSNGQPVLAATTDATGRATAAEAVAELSTAKKRRS